MGRGHKFASMLGALLGGPVGGDNKVNPVVFLMGLVYNSVFIGVPREVVDVVDAWIAEIEPHRRVEDVPLAEVAVGDGVVL